MPDRHPYLETGQQDYTAVANRLKLLAHPERLRFLDAIRRDAECVCHLGMLLAKPQPYVSQQLRLLREAGLIEDRKQGQNVYYFLVDGGVRDWLAYELLGLAPASALAFMMAVVALSLPEMIILRRVLKPRLIGAFVGVVAGGIMLTGYLFNIILSH